MLCNKRSHCKSEKWEIWTSQLETSPCSLKWKFTTTRESPPAATKTQCSQNYILKIKYKKKWEENSIWAKTTVFARTLKNIGNLRSQERQKKTVWMEQGGWVVPISWSTSRPRLLFLPPFHILAHIPLGTDKLQLEHRSWMNYSSSTPWLYYPTIKVQLRRLIACKFPEL